MGNNKDKNRAASSPSSYGTFQGVPINPPPSLPPRPPSHHPVAGLPRPSQPPGASHHDHLSVHQYIQEHQTVPGYPVAEGRHVQEHRLPCCGIGIGWFLFFTGFLLGAVPWYIAVFLFVCTKISPQEKPGYIACAIAAVLATIAIVFGVIGGRGVWS
ncbi:hypothetical protein AALP_AA4G028000 [Arabis alpina]|uniref:60S ribosomal protein L18a-like protein n=1 Tax=Arabis alpina TaxID=50452 RepID=A0A087H0R5_ARAAL|nr:hypothetical protein AALP_AA4G028000 [Arabis alpina]